MTLIHHCTLIAVLILLLVDFQKVRMKGLEPSLLSELEPKSSASANFATSALVNYPSIAHFIKRGRGKIFL